MSKGLRVIDLEVLLNDWDKDQNGIEIPESHLRQGHAPTNQSTINGVSACREQDWWYQKCGILAKGSIIEDLGSGFWLDNALDD